VLARKERPEETPPVAEPAPVPAPVCEELGAGK
jgi:hypothetical protein